MTEGLKYHEVLAITRREAEATFSQGQPEHIVHALLSIAYHEPDWRWVQEWCMQYARHEDQWVRRTAITCFGHLARIHTDLDERIVLPLLKELQSDSEVSDCVADALDDIATLLGKSDA